MCALGFDPDEGFCAMDRLNSPQRFGPIMDVIAGGPLEAFAFRELGLAFPEMQDLADYNLGLSQYRQDEPALARESFLSAADSEDPQIATLAGAMLARLPEASPAAAAAPRWFGMIDFGLGHDDNVALIDPLVLPAGRSRARPGSSTPSGRARTNSGSPKPGHPATLEGTADDAS